MDWVATAHDAIAEIHHLSSGANKFQWVLEADIKACFDEIDHTALMDRLRARIKDKRVCTLVKAFLKSGVMTTSGDREETLTGTPQGGILSPLLANIALSALDEHFARQWQQEMGSYKRRVTRRKHGLGGQLAAYPFHGRLRTDGLRGAPPCREPARGGGRRARPVGAASGTGEDPGGPHR